MVEFGVCGFNADVEENKKYYLNNQLCDCLACKNYYSIIDKCCPKLVSFLRAFGIDATRPDELSWLEENLSEQTVSYEAMYSVKGFVTTGDTFQLGQAKTRIDDLEVCFGECDFPNGWNTKCYGIRVFVVLPWEQDEPYTDWFCTNKVKRGFLNRTFIKDI